MRQAAQAEPGGDVVGAHGSQVHGYFCPHSDYLTCPEDDIRKVEAIMTMVSGRVVYKR